ncbi:MAG: hypothetical protein ACI4UK_02410, partial [Floccifex sp.]
MPRKPNTYGGGARTNANGLHFEQTTSLNEALANGGYRVASDGTVCNLRGEIQGYSKSKHAFIQFLKDNDVDLNINSDTLLPDDAFINTINETVYIIEKKFQNCSGSVDEKLQTCLYKKQQYEKLISQVNFCTEYVYVLSDWFRKD